VPRMVLPAVAGRLMRLPEPTPGVLVQAGVVVVPQLAGVNVVCSSVGGRHQMHGVM
jgi:hypothetical protein